MGHRGTVCVMGSASTSMRQCQALHLLRHLQRGLPLRRYSPGYGALPHPPRVAPAATTSSRRIIIIMATAAPHPALCGACDLGMQTSQSQIVQPRRRCSHRRVHGRLVRGGSRLGSHHLGAARGALLGLRRRCPTVKPIRWRRAMTGVVVVVVVAGVLPSTLHGLLPTARAMM